MPFQKGNSGRPKGAISKKRKEIEEMAAQYDCDPFEILLMIAMGDWKALEFEAKSKTVFTAQGIEMEVDNIPLETRMQAAKEAAKYLHAQKRSIELSGGETGIRIIVDDYTKKEP